MTHLSKLKRQATTKDVLSNIISFLNTKTNYVTNDLCIAPHVHPTVVHQRSFFLQWMAMNQRPAAGQQKEYETWEFSIINKMPSSILPLRLRNLCIRESGRSLRARGWMTPRKRCHPDTAGLMHKWTCGAGALCPRSAHVKASKGPSMEKEKREGVQS